MSIKSITVLDESIRISKDDYFSLTDIAKYKNIEDPNGVIRNWIRNRETIEFLGLWEILNNDDFNPIEFDGFRNASGTNHFTMSPQKWIRGVNSIGITSKSGRYGGTYAHKDIALQFASWISPEIHLYIIKEFQRLKENIKNDLEWNIKRELVKINYHFHTESIRENIIIPEKISGLNKNLIYATEADILNISLFGKTAKEWRNENPNLKGNIRDNANINQLICLSNLENYNALFIEQGILKNERLILLNKIAIKQMSILQENNNNNKNIKK